MSRMPLRGLGCLGDGRDVYIENQENRSADRNALGERVFETTKTTRDNSCKVRRPNRAAAAVYLTQMGFYSIIMSQDRPFLTAGP